MRLGLQDGPTGDLVCEDLAAERPDTTWNTVVDQRRAALGTRGLSLGRARATARMGRADNGVGGLRRPDCFPCLDAMGKRSSLARARE